MPYLLAALGGALGALVRAGLGALAHSPWTTLGINVTGCLVIGVVLVFLARPAAPAWVRPFVVTGVLGGYTTYSTFAVETDLLIKNGHATTGLVYAAASLLAGLVAVWAGIWAARSVTSPHRSPPLGGRR